MARTYAQLREALLMKEESFASFLYLDTRGFLTSGLGYLLVRDAPDAAPGAALQMRALSLFDEVGIAFTPAHRATCNALVAAMNGLPAAFPYPASNTLSAFNGSPLGRALAGRLELVGAKTETNVFTFKVAKAAGPDGMMPVEPLFPDRAKHGDYFARFVTTYEDKIDHALAAHPNVALDDSKRLGLFSAVWNRPSVAEEAIAALARAAPLDDLLAIMSAHRPVSADRVRNEVDLLTGARQAEDVAPR